MKKQLEVYILTRLNGETLVFRYGSSVCKCLDIPYSTFARNISKGYYQRNGDIVKKYNLE